MHSKQNIPEVSVNEAPRSKGFTLMEIVVSIIVLSVVLFILSGSMAQSGKIYQFVLDSERISSSARHSLDLLFQELKYLDSLTVADDHEIEFITQDGLRINYEIFPESVQRSVDGGEAAVLSRSVAADQSGFTFLNRDLDPLNSTPLSEAHRSLVRFVDIRLTLSRGELQISSQRQVFLENARW